MSKTSQAIFDIEQFKCTLQALVSSMLFIVLTGTAGALENWII